MKSNHQHYNFEKSRERIDDILKTADKSFEEVDKIPSRDKLTFNNGFYVNKTTALFVDIRNSSQLPSKYKRPVLARIYRAYISEVVAVINSNNDCSEISINGDCIWGVFDAQYKSQIDDLFSTAAQIVALIKVLNVKFKKKNIDPISVGIGLDFGRALMIKAGYNGSGINDVVWMGEVVNGSSNLCSKANKDWNEVIMASSDIYSNLNTDNQKLLNWNSNESCYHGNVVNTLINDWAEENK